MNGDGKQHERLKGGIINILSRNGPGLMGEIVFSPVLPGRVPFLSSPRHFVKKFLSNNMKRKKNVKFV